jgi:hypothetical protein
MVRRLAALALAFGCQTHEDATSRVETGSGSATPAGSDARAVEHEVRVDARVQIDEPEKPDPGKQLAELGAIPAWQAAVDRTLYLERRGQHGVVFGTLGPPVTVAGPPSDAGASEVATPYTWLVDDTEGNGALAIRVALGKATAKTGDRVALAGAWALDDTRHWYWNTTSVTALPAAPPSKAPSARPQAEREKDPPAAPGHAISNGELPAGARPITLAKEGDAAYFTVVGSPPVADGDGWLVADELGNPPYALLNMPGERASYGAQDMRTPDERWQLKRGQSYWVRIGPVHHHGPDKPATINARTAPVRVK